MYWYCYSLKLNLLPGHSYCHGFFSFSFVSIRSCVHVSARASLNRGVRTWRVPRKGSASLQTYTAHVKPRFTRGWRRKKDCYCELCFWRENGHSIDSQNKTTAEAQKWKLREEELEDERADCGVKMEVSQASKRSRGRQKKDNNHMDTSQTGDTYVFKN